MQMKHIGGILWNELSVWMRNGLRKNHFGLDCVKNNNKILIIKNKVNKEYILLLLFILKIIWIFNNPKNKIQ